MSDFKKIVFKLAKQNPEFGRALLQELTAAKSVRKATSFPTLSAQEVERLPGKTAEVNKPVIERRIKKIMYDLYDASMWTPEALASDALASLYNWRTDAQTKKMIKGPFKDAYEYAVKYAEKALDDY